VHCMHGDREPKVSCVRQGGNPWRGAQGRVTPEARQVHPRTSYAAFNGNMSASCIFSNEETKASSQTMAVVGLIHFGNWAQIAKK
jgi:hypothetical protein